MFSDKLKVLRKKNGLTQKELGKILGVSRGTIAKYETNRLIPENDIIIAMSQYFGVSVFEFDIEESENNLIESMKVSLNVNKVCLYMVSILCLVGMILTIIPMFHYSIYDYPITNDSSEPNITSVYRSLFMGYSNDGNVFGIILFFTLIIDLVLGILPLIKMKRKCLTQLNMEDYNDNNQYCRTYLQNENAILYEIRKLSKTNNPMVIFQLNLKDKIPDSQEQSFIQFLDLFK